MAKKKIQYDFLDTNVSKEHLESLSKGESVSLPHETPLIKNILHSLDKDKPIHRLAFEEDPNNISRYAGLFYDKTGLLPDIILKRIAISDDLIATILNIRSSQAFQFGRKLENRHSNGYRLEPKNINAFKSLEKEKKEEIIEKVRKVEDLLFTCGHVEGFATEKQMTLPKFLFLSARNAMLFGRFATELIYDYRGDFCAFRPVDAGTIYKAIPKSEAAAPLRAQAIRVLEQMTKEKHSGISIPRLENDEYTWIQVIQGKPTNAFTSDEMVVHDCYPTTDVELNGYPVTPVDTAFAAITTHINITSHNKFYFQNGRAARGMLVISSDDVDTTTLADLKQHFMAAINSTANAWRMPIIKVGKEDEVTWSAIDSTARDMEFQYLHDSNCRIVMAAFAISPEEVPGYSHLSKGTNNQALSESNNEYKLEAHRDVGIRPMLAHLQDFLNFRILPLLDKEIAESFNIKLYGLEAEGEEKERTSLTEESDLHLTYDEILEKVEKNTIGKKLGGQFPLNPRYQAILDKYFTVGTIMEEFFGIEGASKDPRWAYVRDPFFFQNAQLVMQAQQIEDQKQMAQQQMQMQAQEQQQQQAAAQGQLQQGQPQPQSGGQGGIEPGSVEQGQQAPPQQGGDDGNELASGVDQALATILKSEKDLPEGKRRLVARHEAIVKEVMEQWEKESEKAVEEIVNLLDKNVK